VEEALYDLPLMRHFAQIDLGNEPVPDETTVCKFRHLLEQHNLGGAMLEAVNVHLESRGIKITTGPSLMRRLFTSPVRPRTANKNAIPRCTRRMYGPPFPCKRKVQDERSSLHKCIGPLMESVSWP
jgi:IS5 family transposase